MNFREVMILKYLISLKKDQMVRELDQLSIRLKKSGNYWMIRVSLKRICLSLKNLWIIKDQYSESFQKIINLLDIKSNEKY